MDKKLKILVVTGWYPSILEPLNGDFVKDQVRLLRNEGLQIDLAYADLNIAYLKEGLISKRTKITSDQKNNKDYILTSSFWPKNNFIGLRKWVDSYSSWVAFYISKEGIPDVIHAHTYLGAMIAEKVSEQNNIPYIVTEHFTGWLDGSIRHYHKSLGVTALNKAQKVVAVSESLKRAIQPEIKQPIEVFSNFIDFNIFKSDTSRKSEIFKILGVGDLISRKQWDHLIKAFDLAYNDIGPGTLTIIGDGPLKEELNGLIKNLNMESCIQLVGRKSKQEVAHAMQQSTVLVHTSHTETFGLIYLEALACELPVISYSNGGVNEFKDNNGIIILHDQNSKNLQNAIIQFYLNPEEPSKIRPRFSSKEAIKRYKTLYQALL